MTAAIAHLGIDVGKTGLRTGIFDCHLNMIERWSCASANVPEAQAALVGQLDDLRSRYRIRSAGISLFGPLQVDPTQPQFGAILGSSAPAWSGVNLPAQVAAVLQQEVFFDFDVNAGALAEATLGNGKGQRCFVYLSVGTGIGAAPFRGALTPGHAPQTGHIFLPREEDDRTFRGSCLFHGDCLQGLASGKAMAERWQVPAEDLAAEHPGWDLEARYLARACTNLIYSFSPEVILLGSSVGASPRLSLEAVNTHVRAMLNGFLDPHLRALYECTPAVVRAALGQHGSLVGAALLGRIQAGLRLAAPAVR